MIGFEELMSNIEEKDMDYIKVECITIYEPIKNFHKNYR